MIHSNNECARVCSTCAAVFSLALGAAAFTTSSAAVAAGWASTGSLNTARYSHTATLLLDGRVLVAGGTDILGNRLASAELYNPATGQWTVTGNMSTPRAQFTATLLGTGEVLVAGGISAVNPNGTAGCIGTAELYNPATGQWTPTGTLNAARGNHAAALLASGQVLVAGGFCYDGSGIYETSAELYDPASGRWTSTGSLNVGHAFAQAAVLTDGTVMIAGGGGRTAELYSNGHWKLTTSMIVSRGGDTAAPLPTGGVLVFGGSNLESNATEVYNATTATWSRTHCYCVNPSMGGQTETLLNTGEVLVAGGHSEYGLTPISKLYESATNAWLGTGSLNTARQNHTAALLANGQVLAAGGSTKGANGATVVLSSAELFTR